MPDPLSEDLYETLQVDARADADVIEAAYRVLARRYHPDRDPSPGATARMARINHAWEVLGQPDSRAAYDRERLAPRPVALPNDDAAAQPSTGPKLSVEPAAVALSLRRGETRTVRLAVHTDPPGIRVDAAVTAGDGWLAVRPTTLRGLDEDHVRVAVRARGLAPGVHCGTVTLATSWETRTLPIEAQVLRASPIVRLRLLLGRLWRRAVLLPALAVVLIAAVGAFVALAAR